MNLKELYKIAKDELEVLSPFEDSDFRLEQAEFNKEENVWEIVISYLVQNTNKPSSPIGVLSTSYPYLRMYKKVKIDDNKQVVGFYIYEK
jgi:hypothetical protein